MSNAHEHEQHKAAPHASAEDQRRDLFAAAALTGIMLDPTKASHDPDGSVAARLAFSYADAMIATSAEKAP
jgi:hypothetical protein